jgi:hypothetical protein
VGRRVGHRSRLPSGRREGRSASWQLAGRQALFASGVEELELSLDLDEPSFDLDEPSFDLDEPSFDALDDVSPEPDLESEAEDDFPASFDFAA